MSLFSRTSAGVQPVAENTELVQITENDMADLMAVTIMEACSTDEIDDLIEEAGCKRSVEEEAEFEEVTERSIVKLDKKAKRKQADKMGILIAAKNANAKEYKKLMKLWKLEAVLMKKLEKRYRAAGEKLGREMFKTMGKSKKATVSKAGNRMLKTSTTKISK